MSVQSCAMMDMRAQAFECNEIPGNHLYIMGIDAQKEAKLKWYDIVVAQLGKLPPFN